MDQSSAAPREGCVQTSQGLPILSLLAEFDSR